MIVEGGMYGLSYAGLIAKLQLDKYLALDGYYKKKNTPCLYEHETRPIKFNLVVDDFLVGSNVDGADLAHLKATLRKHYEITEGDGSLYVGIAMDWDYDNRKVTFSMPDYIRKALDKYGVVKGKPEHKPTDKEPIVNARRTVNEYEIKMRVVHQADHCTEKLWRERRQVGFPVGR